MDVRSLPATNTVNEVREMVPRGPGRRAGFDVLCEPCLVRIIAVNAQIAVRPIEEVAYRIGFCIDRPDGSDACEWIWAFLGCGSWRAKSGSRYSTALVRS